MRTEAGRSGRGARRFLAGIGGLTSLELLLAASFSFLVMLGIGVTHVSMIRFFREGTERLRLQQTVDRVTQQVEIEIRRAADFRIYDPSAPADPLAAGPAVALYDAAGLRIGGIAPSGDGRWLVDDAGRRLDDLELVDVWFERQPGGDLGLTLGLRDRTGNVTTLVTQIAPRN